MEFENLKALVHGKELTTHQRGLALTEYNRLCSLADVVGQSEQLPDFLYEDNGQIKIGSHGDTVVTDEWNKWKGGNLR